jgi:hypothetical protein
MPHENERVELEMQILKYRDLLGRVGNEDFHERTKAKIAELESGSVRSTSETGKWDRP